MKSFALASSMLLMTVCLSSCSTTYAKSPTSASVPPQRHPTYPEAMRGTWKLDPLGKPCYLPLSPDADGRFIVKADVIEGYESTYTPIAVKADPNRANAWNVVSMENYLGTQKEEVAHTFTLDGSRLLEKDGEYTAVYVKCTKRKR